MTLLSVQYLNIFFDLPEAKVRAVEDLNFSLRSGEILGIVGESGSGKTQTVLSILGLLASNGYSEGSVRFEDREILNADARELNKIRGAKIAMIFQDSMASLNPYLRIRTQMIEVLVRHLGMNSKDALQRAIDVLDRVKIAGARNRIHAYPHEFSGGMRQRVMIAMALLCNPSLIIADEPTTALDVTVQAQILALLGELKREANVSILLVTHDLGIVAEICDHVLVVYAGRMMEYAGVDEIFEHPYHPYTQALLRSIPRIDREKSEKLRVIPGNPPDLLHKPEGCPFSKRCERCFDPCTTHPLEEKQIYGTRRMACHLDPT